MTGSVFLRWAMSEAPCRSPAPRPRCPSRSSLSWKASPSAQPKAAIAGDDRPRRRWPAARRPRSRRRSGPRSCARSCRSRARRSSRSSRRARRDVDVLALAQGEAGLVVEAHQAQDLRGRGKPRSVRRWSAIRDRLNSVSPVLIAWGTPWSVHSVGRWRRSTSPSSMSSWTRLKLWPSSTAAAPGSAALVLAGDARRRRAGRGAAASACRRGARAVEARGGSGPSRTGRGSTDRGRGRGGRSRPRCRR